MGDVLDEVLGGENDEEESDQIVQSVLDEIGISVGQSVLSLSFSQSYIVNEFLS